MNIYVLDASVVLNFLLGKRDSVKKEFTKVLRQVKNGKAQLYSSYLLPLEIGNGLRYTLDDDSLAGQVLQKSLTLPIEFFVFSKAHYAKILALSYFFKTSFYDTSYHFLAKLLQADFLTCDLEYYKKAKSFGSIKGL